MVSVKALGAIALTLMIAVPILMGYALSSTEETSTAWEVDSTANVTDLLYNHSSTYTAEYLNPYNNKELLTYDGSAYSIVAPNYSTVTTNYTSLPEYTTSTGTISLASATTTTYTNPTVNETFGTGTADNVITKYPMTCIEYNSSSVFDSLTISNGEDEYSFRILPTYLIQDGESTYMRASSYSSVSEWASTWTLTVTATSSVDNSIDIITRSYTEIDPNVNADITFTTSDLCSVKIVTSDGTTYLGIDEATSIIKTTTNTVTVGASDVYENVTGLFIAEQPSVSSISYTYSSASTGNYADPADGWSLTGASSEWWMNGQSNDSVRFMVDLDSGESCTLGPVLSATTASLVGLAYDGDTLTVTDYTASTSTDLGDYGYVMVVLTKTEATVYGLSAWPTLGVWPTTYNYTVVDYDDLDDTFPYVYMSGDCEFRVDLADVVAGTYPSTHNMSFKPYLYYPDQSYNFTIKSVALYGTALNVVNREDGTTAGYEMTVTDGKITVNGTTMSVRGLTISTRENSDGTWNTYVGGELVWENLEYQPYIDIWGEWSLTASMSLLTETTSTQQVWSPGTFAFDKEDFAACGLIVAGVCLVGLGMNGARSGAKMGILLLICGGGALVYLTLI